MYKSTHEAHDYMNRVANHSTKGSRRGFEPDSHNGFHRSMSSDYVQAKAQLILAINRVKEARRAALLLWRPGGMTKVQKKNIMRRVNKWSWYVPPHLRGQSITAFKDWVSLGKLEEAYVQQVAGIKAKMRLL